MTITVSRSTALQPDQAVFAVQAETGTSTGLDGVIASLQSAGISASDLEGIGTRVTSGRLPQLKLEWYFALAVPVSAMNTTIATLTQLQQSTSGMTFSVQGLQVSPQLAAAQTCPIPALMMDARNQAQQLAALAGFNLGAVQAISDGSAGAFSRGSQANVVYAISAFTQALSQTSSPPSCTLVVKFALTQ